MNSPEGGNAPVKAPTSGELSDQIKKYVVVMIMKMLLFKMIDNDMSNL